jgi:predicted XRE-type DNA-binding protein
MQLFDDPIPELKRQVGLEIARAISISTAADVAELLETDAPRISELKRGKLKRFSLETLIRYAHRLARCAQISFAAPAYAPALRTGTGKAGGRPTGG